jgi:Ca2+-binding EF-hand superfamily protein
MPLSGSASGKAGLELSEAELGDARVGHLDEKALRVAMQNFQQLDRNNDGKLSREEFRSGMGMLGVDTTFSTIVFNSFDTGGDGWIDRREFLVAMAVMLHPDKLEDQIDLAFDAYDVNKDGKLEYDELRQVIASIFSTMEQMGISDAGTGADKVAGELFRQMDRGGKGYVTKEDYVHLAKTQPELIKRVGLGGAGKEKRRSKRASAFLDHPPREKQRGGRQRVSGPRKRGTTVTFGSAKWELVVQMMLGIRLAVGRGTRAAGEPASAAIAGSEDSLSISGSLSECSVSASERSAREERGSSPRTPAATAPAAGAPGSSTQHTSGGGGGGSSPPTARLPPG